MVKLAGSSLIESLLSISLVAFTLSLFFYVFAELSTNVGTTHYLEAQQIIDGRINLIQQGNVNNAGKSTEPFDVYVEEEFWDGLRFYRIEVFHNRSLICSSNYIPAK